MISLPMTMVRLAAGEEGGVGGVDEEEAVWRPWATGALDLPRAQGGAQPLALGAPGPGPSWGPSPGLPGGPSPGPPGGAALE